MYVLLRYRFRLYPTPDEERALAMAFGCARVVFNDALAIRKAAFKNWEPYVPDAELSKRLTASKKTPEREWLSKVSAVVLQQSLADLNRGYRGFFNSISNGRKGRKKRPPKFKTRKDNRQAIRFVGEAFCVRPNGRLYLAKIGDVEVRWSRPLPSIPSSVTVIKEASGRYLASLTVEVAEEPLPAVGRECGIDLGLSHFAVLDDGTKVSAPQFLRNAMKKLKMAERALSRKKRGSANWEKSRVKLARAHAHVADARRDFHHKLSTKIIRENQAVYVEDLAVSAMIRTRLSKSVHDAGWSAFTHMLEYKAKLYGREFARTGRWEPTSQLCSACGVKDGPKPLGVREWQCKACGTVHDRDVNAAKNILALGRRESLNARGGDVRPAITAADPDEAGSLRGAA